MLVTTLRIVDSEEEASLHPRAIWNHWKKNVIWDPRSYYGILEFLAAFIMVISPRYANKNLCSGMLIGFGIAPLHWFSNHRQSSNLLTRARTHIFVLVALALILFVSEVYAIFYKPYQCKYRYDCRMNPFVSLSIVTLLVATFVVYTNARRTRKRPVHPLPIAAVDSTTTDEAPVTNVPSGPAIEDYEDESQAAWATVRVADGIEDDSMEPEGQLRL
ncbi:hypothetical protein CPB84DRAFT_1767155 [Gymnopilus junonius]|uniref:Uncharacterized protein n=1 Tax=Gymnopilus junonius TaxID=109634 RepID=A0A9P5NY87_GYMJU|nr:hypothetical protein CPB84DRAFT_1767155 [Gymnopilus junonius]